MLGNVGIAMRTTVAIAAALLLGTGCARIIGPPVPGENLALLPNTQASHPAFIDGNPKTAGETSFPESTDSRFVDITPPSEAYVLLPDVYTISKVAIHTDEIVGFDLYVEDPTQGMKLVGKYDGQKGPIIEVPMKGITRASGVRLRVRRTINDAATRQRNTRVGTLGGRYITGNTRSTASISEIEVIGPSVSGAAPAAEEPAVARDTTAEIGSILMQGLSGDAATTTGKPSSGTAEARSASGQVGIGSPAPMFILSTLSGSKLNLEDLIGNVILINFWSPSTAGSVAESAALTELRNELAVEDFEIVGISTSKDEATVAEFVRSHKVGYPVVLSDGAVEGRYGVGAQLPTTFLIDRQGKIARQFAGPQNRASLLSVVKSALAMSLPDQP